MKFARDVFVNENALCQAVQERFVKRLTILVVLSFAVLSTSIATGQTGTIGFVVDDDAIIDGLFDVAWANRMRSQGLTVVPLPVSYDPTQGAAANVDVFIVSNDVSSGNFVGGIPPSPRLSDRRPIITYEDALYDELGIGETGAGIDGTTIDIDNPDHPLAAGLSGTVRI